MKTFAVIGLGIFGHTIARQLFDMGYEVLAIDTDLEKVNAVADNVTSAVCADAREEAALRSVGIKNCGCVIVAVSDMGVSVLATLLLKEMGIERVVCKAKDKNQSKILKKVGADSVIIPEYEMGMKTAVSLVSNHLVDYIDLSDEYGIIDIAVPKSWISKTIAELNIRKKYEINIIAVKNALDSSSVIIAPPPAYEFGQNDIVVFVGTADVVNRLG